jgi:hypothetical protein
VASATLAPHVLLFPSIYAEAPSRDPLVSSPGPSRLPSRSDQGKLNQTSERHPIGGTKHCLIAGAGGQGFAHRSKKRARKTDLVFRRLPSAHEKHHGCAGRRQEWECPLSVGSSGNTTVTRKEAITCRWKSPGELGIFSFLSCSCLS